MSVTVDQPAFQIIQGSSRPMPVRLYKLLNGVLDDPFDFTGVAEISTCMKNEDGTELMLSKTGGQITVVGNPILGKIQIALTAAQTALLAAGTGNTLELSIDFGTGPVKYQFANAYDVIATVC